MSEAKQNSLTKSKAINVFAENISRRDVARGYLNVELTNVLGNNVQSDNGSLDETLSDLDDEQIDRLLEAISYAYRMNGVFHKITDEALNWSDVELPLDAIKMTETKPHINEIVFSQRVQSNPVHFADYLTEYFATHTDSHDDPEDLNEFRPTITLDRVSKTRIITTEQNGSIEIIDGNHRIVIAAMLGAVSVRAFAGTPNGRESKGMKGDSVFLTLRLQYEQTTSAEERAHLVASCILLAKSSTDGAHAIESYWVDHARTDEVKIVGKDMLAQLLK